MCGSASLRPSDRWSLVVALACGLVGPREQGRGDGQLSRSPPGSSWHSVTWSSLNVPRRSTSCSDPLASFEDQLPDYSSSPCLPCCTETERDFLSFLALEPSNGLGCGYVGLIVSSWLTLSREGWASAAGRRAPREGAWEPRGRPNGGACVCWPGWGAERLSDWLTRLRVPLGCRTARRFWRVALAPSSHVAWSC